MVIKMSKVSKKIKEDKKKVLDEISEKLKVTQNKDSKSKDKKEESSLDEKIENNPESGTFVGPSLNLSSERDVPVLEKITGSQSSNPFFVSRATDDLRSDGGSKTSENASYLPSIEAVEPKYSGDSEKNDADSSRVDIDKLGREKESFLDKSVGFVGGRQKGNSSARENSWDVERFDENESRRKNVFEGNSEVKYGDYRSKN